MVSKNDSRWGLHEKGLSTIRREGDLEGATLTGHSQENSSPKSLDERPRGRDGHTSDRVSVPHLPER